MDKLKEKEADYDAKFKALNKENSLRNPIGLMRVEKIPLRLPMGLSQLA